MVRQACHKIVIYTDGGSRGNPGPAAAAFILADENGKKLASQASFLGKTTNNFAEYIAIVNALQAAGQLGGKSVAIYSDSELAVKQINGQYKVKNDNIRGLFAKAVELLGGFENWTVQYIPRDKNSEADELVNRALNLEQDIKTVQGEGLRVKDEPCTLNPSPLTGQPIKLAVLISGGGRTLLNILDQIKAGRLNAEIPLVISSLSTTAGVEKARAAGLNVKIIRTKDYPDIDRFSSRIAEELDAAGADLVVQGGWLCLWKIPAQYTNRVMNIHPALLPGFGGKGMWGHHVHEAVLAAGCKVSGCTVHFCTNEYDKGPIIIQRCCPVEDDDTPDTLAARVFEQECIAYPQAIRLFADERLNIENGKVKIK
jgi:formyltetrahydrofolate-dependent phosphoribosylglycinamide formyltransferase